MTTEAKVTVALDGASQVKRAFDEMIGATRNMGGELDKASSAAGKFGAAGKNAGQFWKDAGSQMVSSLATVATAALGAATAFKALSLGEAITSTKKLEDAYARMSVGGADSIDVLRKSYRSISDATATSESDVMSWAKAQARATYDAKNALGTYAAFAQEALASGQDIGDQAGIAELLSGTLDIKGADKTTAFLESLRAMSGTLAGTNFNAFKDQLVGLGGAMSSLSMQTDESKRELAAWALAVGKGQTPQQAARIQQGLIGSLEGHAEGLSRQFGANNVLDENGRLKDVPFLVKKIRDDLEHRYGKDARRVAMLSGNFGREAGAAIFNFDENAYRTALGATPGNAGAAAMDAYKATDAGRRGMTELKQAHTQEDLARQMLPMQDALGSFNADHPYLSMFGSGVGTLALNAARKAGFSALIGGGAATTSAAEASLLSGGGLANAGLLGGVGLAGAGIMSSLGALTAVTAPLNAAAPQVRDETQAMLDTQREGRARAIVAAVERGGYAGPEGVERELGAATLGAVKQDPALASLLQQFESQSTAIQGMPDNIARAVADALKGSPINVTIATANGQPVMGSAAIQNGNSRQ